MKTHKNEWSGKNGEKLKFDQQMFILKRPGRPLVVLEPHSAEAWLQTNDFPESGVGIPQSLTARACVVLKLNPEWPDWRVAEFVGCSKANLSKCAAYQEVRRSIRADGAAKKHRARKSRRICRKPV
jgi:hypothetical protein